MRLFELPPIEAPEVAPVVGERDVDIDVLAQEIWNRFHGHTKTMKQIYIALANTDVYKGEIDRAVTSLKRQNRVGYEGQRRIDTPIRFTKKGS
jgi:hypothetical protein